jgi:hypothetical protein
MLAIGLIVKETPGNKKVTLPLRYINKTKRYNYNSE